MYQLLTVLKIPDVTAWTLNHDFSQLPSDLGLDSFFFCFDERFILFDVGKLQGKIQLHVQLLLQLSVVFISVVTGVIVWQYLTRVYSHLSELCCKHVPLPLFSTKSRRTGGNYLEISTEMS